MIDDFIVFIFLYFRFVLTAELKRLDVTTDAVIYFGYLFQSGEFICPDFRLLIMMVALIMNPLN